MDESQSEDLIPPTVAQVQALLALTNRLHNTEPLQRAAVLVEALMQLLDADQMGAWVKSPDDDQFRLTASAGRHEPPAHRPCTAMPEATLLDELERQVDPDAPLVHTWHDPQSPGQCLASICCWGNRHHSLISAWRGDGAFDQRHRSLLHLLHPQVQWVLGEDKPFGPQLAPGTHAVLELMLTGIAEKEIARRLGRSVHTVHSHIKRVYKEYAVSSRSELLLRFFGKAANSMKQSEPLESDIDA
ncbi:MAG: response regulator transcription factor [Tepidisphaeraceae bacterium]